MKITKKKLSDLAEINWKFRKIYELSNHDFQNLSKPIQKEVLNLLNLTENIEKTYLIKENNLLKGIKRGL